MPLIKAFTEPRRVSGAVAVGGRGVGDGVGNVAVGMVVFDALVTVAEGRPSSRDTGIVTDGNGLPFAAVSGAGAGGACDGMDAVFNGVTVGDFARSHPDKRPATAILRKCRLESRLGLVRLGHCSSVCIGRVSIKRRPVK
jgi:hypothetical protein